MHSPSSANLRSVTRCPGRLDGGRAFTLIELLVVIAILAGYQLKHEAAVTCPSSKIRIAKVKQSNGMAPSVPCVGHGSWRWAGCAWHLACWRPGQSHEAR